MSLNFSEIEELLKAFLGIKFGKASINTTEFEFSSKLPSGQMIRKTSITEIVRDGQVIKRYFSKGINNGF